MKRFANLLHFLAAGAMLIAGCSAGDEPFNPDGRPGDGAYRYVLGFDPVSGEQILGGSHEVVVLTDDRGKSEAIDDLNRANRLHPELSQSAHQKYDPTLTAGESDWEVFASNWWAQSNNGTAWRWQPGASQDYNDLSDKDRLSPLEKYDLLYNPGQPKQVAAVEHCRYQDYVRDPQNCTKVSHPAVTVAGPATKWELENQGVYQWVEPENWWGHCNGWASYATAEPLGYPKRDIRVKLVAGKVTECAAGEAGCMLFKMADIEALMTELYFSDQATFTGRRCDTAPDEIARDEFGRPTDVKCRDLNAGALHIAMVGMLGRGAKNMVTNQPGRPAFVIDHNYDYEVWNFPLVKYEIHEQEEISEQRANELVGASGSDYRFNASAVKFVRVKMSYFMVSDGVSPSQLLKPANQRSVPLHEVELNYVLELDAQDRILGGEWIKDPSTSWGEDNKKLHPDFAWMAINPKGYGEDADDLGGNSDNPFISYSKVKALLQCANDPTTCAPAGTDPDPQPAPSGESCEGACGGQAASGCYCDAACTTYNDCCSDYAAVCTGGGTEPTAPSCEGHCGATGPVPGSTPACYCDAACTQYGDCCSDHATVCE